MRIVNILLMQLRVMCMILSRVERKTPVYFWIADKMLFPFWAAKLKGADVRFFVYGNVMKEGKRGFFSDLSGRLIIHMANSADCVCIESPGVLKEWEPHIRNGNVRIIHLYSEIRSSVSEKKENVIGMLCRLSEGKHVVEGIRAFARFHAAYPDYRLEIFGSGKLESACRNLIEELDMQAHIRLAGWVDHASLGEKTARWRYLLFPTDAEGMPNSVIEMMGQGVPAIASPVGGIRDLVVDGRNGYLLSEPTEEAIHCALLYAMAHEARYADMAEAAWDTVRAEYSLAGAQARAIKSI